MSGRKAKSFCARLWQLLRHLAHILQCPSGALVIRGGSDSGEEGGRGERYGGWYEWLALDCHSKRGYSQLKLALVIGLGKKNFVARYWLSSETETWHGVKLGVPKFIKGKPSFRAGKIVLNVPTDWTYSPSLTSEEVVRSGHFVDPVVFDGQDVVFDTDGSGGPFSSDLRLSKCAMLLLLSMFPKRGNASQPNFEIRMVI